MSDQQIFDEARDAILKGQRERAKDLLTRMLSSNKDDPELWLMMSSVVDTSRERIYCLQAALKLDPENKAARQGLTLLGAIPPDESIEPILPVRRKWVVTLEDEELTGFAKIMANPVLRVLTFSAAGLLVVGLILVGVFATPGSLFRGPDPTVPSWTPTPTLTDTPTPLVRTPTPTPATAIPLWMLLDETYTPVPAYVNTPHPISEAYRAGMRAFDRGEYNSMLEFMLQALVNEPDMPDIHFHIGEAYRLQEEYQLALDSYNQALEINPRFAPAYLGRAWVQSFLNPRADISSDLEKAIEYDPAYGDAYIKLAQYLFDKGEEPDIIIELLESGQDYLQDNPRFYLMRALSRLALDDEEGALQDARYANELDLTILDGYLVLAQALLANDMPEEAIQNLNLYGRYESENPIFWAYLGWAYHGIEDYEAALESYEKAYELDPDLYETHLFRGQTHIALGSFKEAINDLYLARQIDPNSFAAHFHYAMALVSDERPEESITFFDIAENLAISDRQSANVYYHRALAFISVSLPNKAKEDFSLLLLLPSNAVPRLWIVRANQFLATSTPTSTPSNTPTPSRTPTNTATFTFTPTPTNTFTPTPTSTNTNTSTPSPTNTQTSTNTATLTPTRTSTPTPSLTP